MVTEVRVEKPKVDAVALEPCAAHPAGPDPDRATQAEVAAQYAAVAVAGQDCRNRYDSLREQVRRWMGL